MPYPAASSHSAAKLSMKRDASGSLSATSALPAPRRAAVASTASKSRTSVSGLRRRISTSSTAMPVSARRASVSRMMGVSPIVAQVTSVGVAGMRRKLTCE